MLKVKKRINITYYIKIQSINNLQAKNEIEIIIRYIILDESSR